MGEPDLEQRLDILGRLLGQKVTLVEPPEDISETESTPAIVNPAAWQWEVPSRDGWSQQPKEPAPVEEPDAPRKFLNHDAGPRANVRGAFDCASFKVGEPIAEDAEFCPWKVVRSYPYNFVGKTNRPHVEPYFEKLCDGRVWDLFYLYHPTHPKEKPFLFVPTSQFQIFLDHINRELNISLSIPAGVPSERFFIRFSSDLPRPRYLRRICEDADLSPPQWPDLSASDAQVFMAASPILQQELDDKLKLVNMTSAKDKKQRSKEKAAEKRANRGHMLSTAQQLLGLKENKLVGVQGGDNVVFVCVDVEALERPPNPISEVGFAILDARDIKNVARGPCGRDWWPMITAHHLRTKEYSGLRNYEFVQGCPDAFDFGISTFPSRDELPDAIMSVLHPYIDASRELVLVGHDIRQDIQYLDSIGIDLMDMKCISRMLDSQVIHQSWKDLGNGRGLAGVLADLGIQSKHLHNAGNDAVFTLQALIGVAIEQIRQESAEKEEREYEPELWST